MNSYYIMVYGINYKKCNDIIASAHKHSELALRLFLAVKEIMKKIKKSQYRIICSLISGEGGS